MMPLKPPVQMMPLKPPENVNSKKPPPENTVDGDDEREDEEEKVVRREENEKDEPRLKYHTMEGCVPKLLASDDASCIAATDRMLALGTRDGSVHILDTDGNRVKVFLAHSAAVNDLCFDIKGDYIGSCSDDGLVAIYDVFIDKKTEFEFDHPIIAIALDPEYAESSRFLAGDLAGHLHFRLKKFRGHKNEVIHSSDGPIHAVKWKTNLVAWANDAGVEVYDSQLYQSITFIETPRGNSHPENLPPHISWLDDALLAIGWLTSVKIASFRSNRDKGRNGKQVDIVASFQTNNLISGIAPFGDSLVVLVYIPGEDDKEKEFKSTVPSRQGNAQRPVVRVVTRTNDELVIDSPPFHGFEHFKAKDYSLAHTPFSGSSDAGGQWIGGRKPFYYVVSPKCVVVAQPRDTEDHICWLSQHGWNEKALAAVEAGEARGGLLDEVGIGYLDHLIVARKYAEAAFLCPKLLQGSSAEWERWILHFTELRQLPVLIPYIPTKNPRLPNTTYEVVLITLAKNPSFHKDLLSTLKLWPHLLYSALPVISAIEGQLHSSSMTEALKEELAKLYAIGGRYEEAFFLYTDLKKPDVFDFIKKHDLHDVIGKKVFELMLIDSARAVELLTQHPHLITSPEVVPQLLAAKKEGVDLKGFLYQKYELSEANLHAVTEFHDMLVELYADHDPTSLLDFLCSRQHYTLQKAYAICCKRDLFKEQAFLLGRLGNSKQALEIIINKLGDFEGAIEFANKEHDDAIWKELLILCLDKPDMVRMLLERPVGNLDPLYILKMVPNGLEIPRDTISKIETPYIMETCIRRGITDIHKTDIGNLFLNYLGKARNAVVLGNKDDEAQQKKDVNRAAGSSLERSPSMRNMDVKSKTTAGGRCCMCPVPLTGQTDVSVVVFFCGHQYHMTCLPEFTNSVRVRKQPKLCFYEFSNESDEDDEADNGPQMRCVLCSRTE